MNSFPSYDRYSLSELYDVLTHIDCDRYPDREALVLAEIKKRQNTAATETEDIATKITKPAPGRRWWSGAVVIGVAIIAFVALMTVGNESSKKDHKVYRDAFYFVSNSPQIKAVLGEPVEAAFWIEAELPEESSGGRGGSGQHRFGPMMHGPAPKASYRVPISGPNGQALLIAEAEQVKGQWEFTRLDVEVATDSTVLDLIEEELPEVEQDTKSED